MTRLLTLGLMVSAVALSACSGTSGKTYPAPYANDRTAGSVSASHGGEQVFEKKMTK